jgi:hypothetical protein
MQATHNLISEPMRKYIIYILFYMHTDHTLSTNVYGKIYIAEDFFFYPCCRIHTVQI